MLSSLMALANQIAANDMLLNATRQVRQPGIILGPISKLLGFISDFCFKMVYSITPIASLGITIIFFTIIVKILLFPLAIKGQKSMLKTQKLQPKIQAIQEKYKDSKNNPELQQKMSMEMSSLYKDNKINPLSGCLPLLIQMPILFALYYVIQQPEAYIPQIAQVINDITSFVSTNMVQLKEAFISVYQSLGDGNLPMDQIQFLMNVLQNQEMYYIDVGTVEGITKGVNAMTEVDMENFIATFFSQYPQFLQSQSSVFVELNQLLTLKDEIYNFGFLNLVQAPGFKFPGILVPVITWLTTYLSYKVSMSIQSKNNKASANDMMQSSQKMMTMIFPFMMAFTSISIPSGLGLYWNVTNIIQIGQQWTLNKFFSTDKFKDDENIIEAKEVKKPKKKGV